MSFWAPAPPKPKQSSPCAPRCIFLNSPIFTSGRRMNVHFFQPSPISGPGGRLTSAWSDPDARAKAHKAANLTSVQLLPSWASLKQPDLNVMIRRSSNRTRKQLTNLQLCQRLKSRTVAAPGPHAHELFPAPAIPRVRRNFFFLRCFFTPKFERG